MMYCTFKKLHEDIRNVQRDRYLILSWECGSFVNCLPTMYRTLGFDPQYYQNQNKTKTIETKKTRSV